MIVRKVSEKYNKVSGLTNRFIVGVLCVILILLVGIFYKLYENDLKLQEEKRLYYDDILNFSISIPNGWEVTIPDKEEVYNVVKETTGGVLFDVRGHFLKKEIVPLTLTKNSPNEKVKYSKFMTIALRGNNEFYKESDFIKLKDSFESLLRKLEHSDIKVKSVGFLDELESVIVLKGEGKLKDNKIYYTQYYEQVGSNLMIITHGSTKGYDEGLEDITNLLSTLLFKEGGIALPDPLKEEMIKEFDKKGEEFTKNKDIEEENEKNQSTEGKGSENNVKESTEIKLPTSGWDVKKK